jgi:TPR repeat protein
LAAGQGNTGAQYNLGDLYQKHSNIKLNYQQAFKWYSESAQGGNSDAQKSLAYFYLKGLATDIDYGVALSWYTKAAEAGDPEAQVILGKLYRKGEYTKEDLLMAVKWYSQAARQGNTVAQSCLSQLYQRGILNNIDLEEDMSVYTTEDSMNGRLRTKLSVDISKLGDLIEQDYHSANIWYKKLAKQKDANAQCNVGAMYNEGLDVRHDPLEASK